LARCNLDGEARKVFSLAKEVVESVWAGLSKVSFLRDLALFSNVPQ
jgi:hypothetical protein